MTRENPFISQAFKLWVGAIIFALVGFNLYIAFQYPQFNILSKEVTLGVVLGLVVYMWVQELRDRYRMHHLNASLVMTQKRLEDAEVDTIAVLILAEEEKDKYACGHSGRVASFACIIAEEMDLPKGRKKVISRAGRLHDLGKMGIMDSILQKPDKLSEEEWLLMREHPRRAIDILKPLKFLSIEKGIILHHHERFDGQGYPDGLEGKTIPLEARIMAVADSFDAMNSDRPYRSSLSREDIVQELKRVSGTQLDPAVVSAFLILLERNPKLWEKEISLS